MSPLALPPAYKSLQWTGLHHAHRIDTHSTGFELGMLLPELQDFLGLQ